MRIPADAVVAFVEVRASRPALFRRLLGTSWDRLSRYVQHVQDGAEVVVTMRGRRVARLVPIDETDPLADLRARGLVREPIAPRNQRPRRARLKSAEPVSELVADQ